MIKTMLFVKRTSGLTHKKFRARHRSGQMPLTVSGASQIAEYRRNSAKPMQDKPEGDFDAATGLWFDNEDGWKATAAQVLTPAKGRIFADVAMLCARPVP